MSDVLLTVFSFVVVLGSLTAILGAAIGAGGKSTEAWVDEARAAYTASIGDIRGLFATAQESAGTTIIDVAVENTGAATYADWDSWDVAIHYTGSGGSAYVQRLDHAATLATGKWVVEGIYLDAAARGDQGVDPTAFNPTEQMVLRLQVAPVAGSGTTGMVVITTQDALSTRIHFEP